MLKLRRYLVMLCVLYSSCATAAITVVDDRGVSVSFVHSPERIVSLLPSLTETVCALDQCKRLVGVDRYSNFPPEVQGLPQLGSGFEPVVEAVVALRPDVVLLATSSRAADHLQSLGLKVLAFEPKNFTDVQRTLFKIAALLEVNKAEKVWQALDATVTQAAQTVPTSIRGMHVYFEVNEGPYAASETSFIGEILQRLGMKNIVPGALGAFPKLNPEFIVRTNPDVIMIGEQSANVLKHRPGWGELKALKNNQVCTFEVKHSDILVRPGPRLDQAAQLIANCLKHLCELNQKNALSCTQAQNNQSR